MTVPSPPASGSGSVATISAGGFPAFPPGSVTGTISSRLLAEGASRDAAYVLTHMLDDSDFNAMRGAALAKLPEEERQAWQAVWADLSRILDQVRAKRRK